MFKRCLNEYKTHIAAMVPLCVFFCLPFVLEVNKHYKAVGRYGDGGCGGCYLYVLIVEIIAPRSCVGECGLGGYFAVGEIACHYHLFALSKG